MSPLLPPTVPVEVSTRRGLLRERQTHPFDAVIVLISAKDSHETLAQLPNGRMWLRLRQTLHRGGNTPHLVARLDNAKTTVMVVGFVTEDAMPFSCLTQAAKLVKEIGIEHCTHIALAGAGLSQNIETVALESLLAATLAAAVPMPQFKRKPAKRPALKGITIFHCGVRPKLDTALATHAGNYLARWLTTLPPNQLNCQSYARALRTLAARQRWQYRIFNEAALKRAGAGAFLAVSRANAHRGASIVKLSYRPRTQSRHGSLHRLALVGKGVCFDTGGINLKPHKSMYQMHEDMQGSAVAVGTLLALTELQVPFAVDCWLALTENEIGPHAYRPQEVVTAVNGVTIQVVHSDAEGRMALADTLALAARDKPNVMLDFATLTGSCIGALTERMSGVFTNRPAWHATLEKAGRDSGERVWPFPMDEDYDSDLDSHVADVLQCTLDSKGDHILAARFLNRFVPKETGWVHVDLAASNRSGGLAHIPTDFTGFGVRFAVEWLLKAKAMSVR